MNLSPLPIQKFFDSNGNPLVGGLLFTYAAGTSTKVATAKDQAGTPNTNPVVLDYRGECNVWLDQTLTYKFVLAPAGDTDPPTKAIWTVDNILAAVTYVSLTASIIGQILYPRTAAEITAGVTPTNYYIPSHTAVGKVLMARYGWVSSTSTNQTTILANARLVARASGAPLEIPAGTTRFTPPLIWDKACGLIGESREDSILLADGAGLALKIDIDGEQAELCDFKLDRTGAAGNGIEQWNGGRVTLRRLIVQNHTIGILLRGGNLGSYTDIKTITNTSDGFKIDSGTGYGDSCWDCHFSNLDSRNNGGWGFNLNSGQSHDGTITTQNNTGGGTRLATNNNDLRVYSEANTTWDIFLEPGVVGNVVANRNADSVAKVAYRANNLITDGAIFRAYLASNFGAPAIPTGTNAAGLDVTFAGGGAGAGATGFGGGKGRVIGGDAAGTAGAAAGGDVELVPGAGVNGGARGGVNITSGSFKYARAGIAYSASMTPDAATANIQAIRANNGAAFTINAPLNPREAIPLTITIVNISGGALGAATWNAIFKMSAWTQPANGFNRSVTFYWDGTNWIQKDQTGVDVPN